MGCTLLYSNCRQAPVIFWRFFLHLSIGVPPTPQLKLILGRAAFTPNGFKPPLWIAVHVTVYEYLLHYNLHCQSVCLSVCLSVGCLFERLNISGFSDFLLVPMLCVSGVLWSHLSFCFSGQGFLQSRVSYGRRFCQFYNW